MTLLPFLAEAAWLDAPRLRRIGLVLAILGLAAIGADTWLHTRAGLADLDGNQLGRDFLNYWSGAHLAAEGRANRVFDLWAFWHYEQAHAVPGGQFRWYSYPPAMLLLTLPLAALGYVAALIAWSLAGPLLNAALLRHDLGWRDAVLAMLATPAALLNLVSGQNGQFTAALFAGGLMLLDRRPAAAGALLGLLCCKPQLALLVPVALTASGRWRAFLAAGGSALAVCALSYALFGAESWHGFLRNMPLNFQTLENGVGLWPRMPTPYAAVRLLGGGNSAAWAAQAISALAAVTVTALAWRASAPRAVQNALLVLATFCVSPYAWDYDMVVVTFAVAWLIREGRSHGFLPGEKIVLAALAAMPLALIGLAGGLHIQLAPLLVWATVLMAARRAMPYPAGSVSVTQPA